MKTFLSTFSALLLISCGGSSKENVLNDNPAPQTQSAPAGEADEGTAGETGKQAAGTEAASGAISVTAVGKEEGGKYSATINKALVFKGLEIKKGDQGGELLYFPKSPGRDDREYHIVYLDDRSIARLIKDAIKAGKAEGQGKPGDLKVTAVKWKALDGQSKVKGFADVTFNNAITIKGCKLIEGQKGIWMAWPSVRKDKDYVDLVFAIDKGVRDMTEAAVKKESGL